MRRLLLCALALPACAPAAPSAGPLCPAVLVTNHRYEDIRVSTAYGHRGTTHSGETRALPLCGLPAESQAELTVRPLGGYGSTTVSARVAWSSSQRWRLLVREGASTSTLRPMR